MSPQSGDPKTGVATMADPPRMSPGLGSVPQPDPTVLTTQQMLREVSVLKELVEAQVHAVDRVVEQRFNGMDRALSLLQAKADKVPSETDVAVGNLQSLHEARFHQIDVQFSERDTRATQTATDIKSAVDAALKAASSAVELQNRSNQEAIAKQEIAFTKQIDQIANSILQINKTIDDRLGDVKDRITAVETSQKAIGDINDLRARITAVETRAISTKDTQKDVWGYFVGAIGIVISIITVLFLIMNNSNRIERSTTRTGSVYPTMIG